MTNVKNVRQNMDPVEMELGGKTRILQFDMNAFAELENKFGSIDAAMDQLATGKIAHIKTIMWAALIHGEVESFDPDSGEPVGYSITPYTVGSWIKNPMMLQEASTKLSAAMGTGMPDAESLPEEVKKELIARGIEAPTPIQIEDEVKNA